MGTQFGGKMPGLLSKAVPSSFSAIGKKGLRVSARFIISALVALLIGLTSTSISNAQATSGQILGVVQDSTGAAVADATVTATNVGTSNIKTTQTDDTGNYRLLYLIPGQYTVEVTKQGFSAVRRSAFDLQVDQKARVDLTLPVGSVTETVTVVTQDEPQLKADSSEQGQVIDSQQITSLPLNTRNFAQLLTLIPGAQPNTGDQGGSANADHPEGISATNVNGLPSDANNWQLDGVSNNEAFFSVLVVNPSVDAIQEFKASTSDYSAEFGRAGGANVQISIKSGANQVHGVAFEFLRNSALDANDYFSKQNNSSIPAFKQNQFGGNLGGPIIKDKTFFFADYEGFRSSKGQTETMTVPTALQREGIFTETDSSGNPQATIYNPETGLAYPNNTVTNIDPVATNILELLPLPNLTGPNGSALLSNNYFGKDDLTHNVDQGDVRVDHRFSERNQAFARYSILDSTLSQAPFLGILAGGDPYLAAVSHTRNQNAVVSDVHAFSPKVINEFRFGLNSVNLFWAPYDTNTTTSADVGIPGINDFCSYCGGLARFSIAGLNDFGHTPWAPTHRHDTAFEFIDNVTILKGKHSFKFGFDMSHIRATLFQTSNPVGAFSFDQNMTSNAGSGGIGLASFLTGYEASATRDAMTNIPSYRTNQLFFFGQDDVRLSDTLTVNLGLRYEIFTAPTERHNDQANFDLATGDLLNACVATSCSGGVKTDYGNVEPRIGFAYRLGNKTVIRSAFGISAFAAGSGGQLGSLANNPPWEQGQSITPDTKFTPGPKLEDGLPALSPLEARSGAAAGHYVAVGSGVIWLEPDLKMTRAYQWNLNIQRTLAANLLLDVAYVGNSIVNRFVGHPGNYPELDPTSTLSIQERRPYYATNPDLQAITMRLNEGHANYHSLQAKLEKRFSYGLSFLASYTWSKSQQRGVDYVNPATYMQYKDVTGSDLTNRFVISYSYELPFGRRKLFGKNFNAWENAALGEWQIQGVTVLRSGFPFSPSITSQLDNGLGNVPNQIGSGRISHPTIDHWFDETAFTQPGDQYGDMRKNNLRGPGGKNSDMSLFKNFYMGANTARYLQFRAEFFNVFNNVQFGTPNSNIGDSNVGTITGLASGSNPREIQGALKLYF